jgi:hypothetical protein
MSQTFSPFFRVSMMLAGCVLIPSSQAQPASDFLNVTDFGASGSTFETTATTVPGSPQITVAEPGDFKAGQWVAVAQADVRYSDCKIYGPGEPYRTERELGQEAEFRGYDGSAGSWMVYLLEVDGADPLTFRWSDDRARTWKGGKVPVTFDWQQLSSGIEVKFKSHELKPGNMISFHARDQLVAKIDKIEGNVFTLEKAANREVARALVRHNDTVPLQSAINAAIVAAKNLYFPAGYYRLQHGLEVRDASLQIEGQDSENTVLDITEGTGACFDLRGGTDITIRNFRMLGHTSLTNMAGSFTLSSGYRFWASAIKPCNAVTIAGTERVLVENVHAIHMASEAFYCQGPYRSGKKEPQHYTKSLTYLRCSVKDCAANGFNNNDIAENTSVLYCRIDGAGWHAWEGPSRFIRLMGNYVRNAGPFTVGDMTHRYDHLNELGCGQAIVTDNVFEGNGRSEGISVIYGSSQVVIANNLFINYNGDAITATSETESSCFPAHTVTIANNIIDMTFPDTSVSTNSETEQMAAEALGRPRSGSVSRQRTGIKVNAANVIVANNQVYVRNQCDPKVTGISIAEPALNILVHDNLVRNCGRGVITCRAKARVNSVVDDRTFLNDDVPFEWPGSHLYRGWNVVWLKEGKPVGTSVLEGYDPKTLQFRLREPRPTKAGDRFEIYSPVGADWNLHDNTIVGCQSPVTLDSYGSESSSFLNNIISRGDASGVRRVIELLGQFRVSGNQISGFDEPGSSVLALSPDRLGRTMRNSITDNVIERCADAVWEATPGLWKAARTQGNQFIGCTSTPSAQGMNN